MLKNHVRNFRVRGVCVLQYICPASLLLCSTMRLMKHVKSMFYVYLLIDGFRACK